MRKAFLALFIVLACTRSALGWIDTTSTRHIFPDHLPNASTAENINADVIKKSFKATIHYDKILLEWCNLKKADGHFIIERSPDGIHFSPIAEINGSNAEVIRYCDET